ncbi:MAG: phosphoadenosine phosphosulfate reductase family protein [Candidatus Azotimanducaceae bacterium WSBS_2022_MAG_OTU7]
MQPLEPVLMEHDTWINGVGADQSSVRAAMARRPFAGCMRYHPMLNWDSQNGLLPQISRVARTPLSRGYQSIGCEPCTAKGEGNERNSRWFGMNKTECGLNTTLVVGGN